MKSKIFCIVSLSAALLLGSSVSRAGGDFGAGNSSDAVLLTNGEVNLLDLVESPDAEKQMLRKLREFKDNAKHLVPVKALEAGGDPLRSALERITGKSADLSALIERHLSDIHWNLVEGQDLPELDDDGVLRNDLIRKQLGIQFGDDVLVNKTLFDALGDTRKRAAFFVHEALIHIVKEKTWVRPAAIRDMVRYFFGYKENTPEMDAQSQDQVIAKFQTLVPWVGLSTTRSQQNEATFRKFDALLKVKLGTADEPASDKSVLFTFNDSGDIKERDLFLELMQAYQKAGLPERSWWAVAARMHWAFAEYTPQITQETLGGFARIVADAPAPGEKSPLARSEGSSFLEQARAVAGRVLASNDLRGLTLGKITKIVRQAAEPAGLELSYSAFKAKYSELCGYPFVETGSCSAEALGRAIAEAAEMRGETR